MSCRRRSASCDSNLSAMRWPVRATGSRSPRATARTSAPAAISDSMPLDANSRSTIMPPATRERSLAVASLPRVVCSTTASTAYPRSSSALTVCSASVSELAATARSASRVNLGLPSMKQPAHQRERTGAAVHSDPLPQRPATGSAPSLTRPGTRSACAVADRRRRPRTQPRIHDRFDGRIAKVRRFPTGACAAHFDAQIEHVIDQIERKRTHVCIVLIRSARTMRTARVKLHFRRCRRTVRRRLPACRVPPVSWPSAHRRPRSETWPVAPS